MDPSASRCCGGGPSEIAQLHAHVLKTPCAACIAEKTLQALGETAPRTARRDLPGTPAESRLGRRLAWLTMGRDTARHI